jgi:hypothetical protein
MTNNVLRHFLNPVLQQQQLSVELLMTCIDQLVMENKVYQLKEQIETEHVYVIPH